MSINTLHAELMKNLESAVDMGKFLGVFNTLIGVIKDQQSKIDDLSHKSEKMAQQLADATRRRPSIQNANTTSQPSEAGPSNEMIQALEDKINALETKLNDTLLELHGLGEDNSILDKEEEPPEFFSLPNSMKDRLSIPVQSARFVATAPSIDELGYDEDVMDENGSPIGFSANASKRSSFKGETAMADDEDVGFEDEEQAGNNAPAAAEEGEPTNEAQQDEDAEVAAATENKPASRAPSKVPTRNPTPVVSARASAAASPAPVVAASPAPEPQPEPEPEAPAAEAEPANLAIKVPSPSTTPAPAQMESPPPPLPAAPAEPGKRVSLRSDSGDQEKKSSPHHAPSRMASTLSTVGNPTARGLLTVTPMEQRPATMRESFSTKIQQVETELFPNRDALTDAYTPKSRAHLRASFTEGKCSYVGVILILGT